MNRNWYAENLEIVRQIEQAYAEDRYVDIDGAVWVGRGEAPDEVWIVESGSDEGYMTKDEMQKKMINELSGTEQYRRDEAVRIEALYEYSLQFFWRDGTAGRIEEDDWSDLASAKAWMGWAVENRKDVQGLRPPVLVRRRKAGPVEVVDS